MGIPEELPAESVPVRSLEARARNLRGRLLVARGENAVEIDAVGSFIYRRIDGETTLDRIAAAIAAEYGIPHQQALADCVEFVAQLQSLGAVMIAD